MDSKTLYLWDMAGTLFRGEWNKEETGFNNYNEWVENKLGKDIKEISDRKHEEMYEIPFKEGYYLKLDLQPGFRKVLSWTKNNEAFTAGVKEQLDWRAYFLNSKVGFDIRDYLNKINSTFDFGETNKKTENMFLSILKEKYKKGFKTIVYTDDKIANVEFFRQVAEKIKEKYKDFSYRVYHILNDKSGLQDKGWYCEVGSLYDLLENEKKIV